MVHLSETCDAGAPRFVVHVDTAPATAHEATRPDAIHAGLAARGLLPAEHLVDAAYISAALLARSHDAHGMTLIGPPWPDVSRQTADGGYGADAFAVDWPAQRVTCPAGRGSASWRAYGARGGARRDPYVKVRFGARDCAACAARPRCVRGPAGGRQLMLRPEAEHAALAAARPRRLTRGPAGLRAARRRRGHALAGGARCWPTPGALPGAPQGAPAARSHGRRAQPRAAGRVTRPPPARADARVALRPARGLTRRLRQQCRGRSETRPCRLLAPVLPVSISP